MVAEGLEPSPCLADYGFTVRADLTDIQLTTQNKTRTIHEQVRTQRRYMKIVYSPPKQESYGIPTEQSPVFPGL